MHPDTKQALQDQQRQGGPLRGVDMADRLARASEAAAQREAHAAEAHKIEQPSIPSATTTDLVTMTMTELHDTIYQATSVQLHKTAMPKETGRRHAARAAEIGEQIVRAQGWTHRGADPRE